MLAINVSSRAARFALLAILQLSFRRQQQQQQQQRVEKPATMAQAISENVAPVFEQEANMHLTAYFPPCLQACGVTDFRGREIVHAGNGRVIKQLGSFAYLNDDNLALGSEATTNGIYLLVPDGMAVQAAVAAPRLNLQDSTGVGWPRELASSFCLADKVSCSLLLHRHRIDLV